MSEENQMNQQVNRAELMEGQHKDTLSDIMKKLENTIAEAKEMEDRDEEVAELNRLYNDLQQIQQTADCDAIAVDQCTLEIPNGSIFSLPPLFLLPGINLFNDPFFLQCCITPTQVAALTDCGPIQGVCTVNEVRATGPLNYYLTFNLQTFFNNGADNCGRLVTRPFVCTGTTCVDEILCYTSQDVVDPCPDFCNGNVISAGFRCSICQTENSLTVTYIIVHFLPDCAS
ncbi:hypothetical protein EJF36_19075 [Bacillus sp. HMF5848]|uniref:hypothetical protein n=1 Tax=Bacillus sp. HMF5848 TaxID=2495421 RepID=UPI000F7BA099|nr:hypothetical protein [Bacillus sp. HMF5848]RSK28808.1 hypothetical protein EJF36_19075 [Bacillus sp. HMF5848]